MTPYLKKYGLATLENGYEIIPIKPGTKRPPFDDWEKIRANRSKLDRWLENGRGKHGIGILARKTPMVDIDCRNPAIVKQMIAFTESLCGETLQRVGLAPKTGLLYRTDKPFPKVNSKVFVDEKGVSHKLEVLGDGQQFVAFAVHPDTNQPYRWLEKAAPHNSKWADLPEITRSQAIEIVTEFERLMSDAGYIEKRSMKRLDNDRDETDEFTHDTSPVDLNTDDLRAKLEMVPGAADYDTWLQVGMALWHQYEGDDEGLYLWHEWSNQAQNYDADVLDDKWPTFKAQGRQPVTARLILKLAQEEEKRVAGEAIEDCKDEIAAAKTLETLLKAAEKVKHVPFDNLTRETIIGALIKKRFRDITGEIMTSARVRELTRYENPEIKSKPKWLEGFCYITRDESFFNTNNGVSLSHKAFDAMYNRYMMTKKDRLEGRSAPEHSASHAALNRWEIPTVVQPMYMPGEDLFFTYNRKRYVNFYSDAGIPDVPKKLSTAELKAVETCEAHLVHLFANERDRKLLLDYFAYIAQTQKRISWMPIIQGAESDGKTFLAHMMKVVIGWENVHIVAGEAFEERYNHFMEGALLVFVEEIRLHGSNRYEALNRMKPWITNEVINIRAMRTGAYEIINTASIMAATNHKDAIPAGKNDTRYFPLFSRWQLKRNLEAFNRKHPTYYQDLYETLKYAGALRKWLLSHEISDDFNPHARAPESSYKAEMIALNESEEEASFLESIEASTQRDYCDTLLDSNLVSDKMEEHGGEAPYGRALNRLLSENGFTLLPKKVKLNGRARKFWTRKPDMFINGIGQDNEAIRDWLEPL